MFRIRYAAEPRAHFIAKHTSDNLGMGEGFYWTSNESQAHQFATEAQARDTIARIIPEVNPQRLSVTASLFTDEALRVWDTAYRRRFPEASSDMSHRASIDPAYAAWIAAEVKAELAKG